MLKERLRKTLISIVAVIWIFFSIHQLCRLDIQISTAYRYVRRAGKHVGLDGGILAIYPPLRPADQAAAEFQRCFSVCYEQILPVTDVVRTSFRPIQSLGTADGMICNHDQIPIISYCEFASTKFGSVIFTFTWYFIGNGVKLRYGIHLVKGDESYSFGEIGENVHSPKGIKNVDTTSYLRGNYKRDDDHCVRKQVLFDCSGFRCICSLRPCLKAYDVTYVSFYTYVSQETRHIPKNHPWLLGWRELEVMKESILLGAVGESVLTFPVNNVGILINFIGVVVSFSLVFYYGKLAFTNSSVSLSNTQKFGIDKAPVCHRWTGCWLHLYIGVLMSITLSNVCSSCSDIGADIRNGEYGDKCLQYDNSARMMYMSCSIKWRTKEICMVLNKGEIFEGNGYEVDLHDLVEFEGLFIINNTYQNGPVSSIDAASVRNVHAVGGQTTPTGGFFIQSGQQHFIVHNCSSTGTIQGGGICGDHCHGYIEIIGCWSTGDIDIGGADGRNAGGITGSFVGENDGNVHIIRCWSTGTIGEFSGGICGANAGGNGGYLFISQSYSTGDIFGPRGGGITAANAGKTKGNVIISHSYSTGTLFGEKSGGICGVGAGSDRGVITIRQCHSLGDIHGDECGGITGSATAWGKGLAFIHNCYSRGNITGSKYAGGICGSDTGGSQSRSNNGKGIVILKNVYASGAVLHMDSGGLIGSIDDHAKEVTIWASVYNGGINSSVGASGDADKGVHNSGNLADITSTVYCYNSSSNATINGITCWDTRTIWKAVVNDFPVLLAPLPSLTPSPSVRQTQTSSCTLTCTTVSQSRTSQGTNVASFTPSITSTPTTSKEGDRSEAPTSTLSQIPAASWTVSATYTASCTLSVTTTLSPSRIAGASLLSPSNTITRSSKATHRYSPPFNGSVSPNLSSVVHVATTTTSTSATISRVNSSPDSSSGLPTATMSASPSVQGNRGGASTLNSGSVKTDILIFLCIASVLSLLIMYVGFKRHQNKKHERQFTDAEVYAIHLGVKNNKSARNESDHINVNGQKAIHSIDADLEAPIADNPMVKFPSIQHGNVHYQRSTVRQHDTQSAPNMETSRIPFKFIDMQSVDHLNLAKVKILSPRQPDLKRISKNSSCADTEPKLHIARLRDIDTSAMATIDRTIIKLRQWKARLLAEPPPVVAIASLDSTHEPTVTHKPYSEQQGNASTMVLSHQWFAGSRQQDDRSLINAEILRYTQSRRRGRLQKKEFIAIPRPFLERMTGTGIGE